MQLGAIVSPLRGQPAAEGIAACQRAGFKYIQVNLTSPPTPQSIQEVLQRCAEHGLQLSALGCYGNPLQPGSRQSEGVSASDIAGLLSLLPPRTPDDEPWRIVTLSGTLSGNALTPHPGNRSPGALSELAGWARGLLPQLQACNACLLLKPFYAHALGDPRALAAFLQETDSEYIGIVMEPCSFLAPKNFHEREQITLDAIKNLRNSTGLVHLRDARIENFAIAMTGPGQGQMGYAGLLKALRRNCADVPWMVDCVSGELQLRRAREFIELQSRLGV